MVAPSGAWYALLSFQLHAASDRPIHIANQTAEVSRQGKRLSLWPSRVLGPPPGMMELNVICWGLFLAGLLIPLGVIQWIHARHEAHPVRELHSDFVYVYGVGSIARTVSPDGIYDLALQQQVFASIQPPRNGAYGPSPYPPFVALLFAPFTYLSFEAAYVLWLGISLAIYLVGIGAVALIVFPCDRLKRSLTYCVALAFYPFLFGTLLNGQLASLAICAIGVALYQEHRGRLFWSGIALSLLCYKPTLLLLIVPMLLLTRRLRTLLGFLTGAGVLIVAATVFAGARIWPLYVQMLHAFAKITAGAGSSRLEIWKYLDLTSCITAIFGHASTGKTILVSATMIGIGIALAFPLWRSAAGGRPAQWLAWGTILTWTLLVNVYVPIYDSVLVVIAAILSLGALEEMGLRRAKSWIVLLSLLIFVLSWITESFAQAHGIQLLTLVLLALGVLQWMCLQKSARMNRQVSLAGGGSSL